MSTVRSILDKVRLIRAQVGQPEGAKAIDKKDTGTLSMFDMLRGGGPAGDPSRSGTLHAETRTDKIGRTEKRWVADAAMPQAQKDAIEQASQGAAKHDKQADLHRSAIDAWGGLRTVQGALHAKAQRAHQVAADAHRNSLSERSPDYVPPEQVKQRAEYAEQVTQAAGHMDPQVHHEEQMNYHGREAERLAKAKTPNLAAVAAHIRARDMHDNATDAYRLESTPARRMEVSSKARDASAAAKQATGQDGAAPAAQRYDAMRDAQAKAREASDQASRVAPPNTGAAGKAKPGKSVKLGATAASEFDLLRELHEDPDGLEDDEREAIGHLVEHHDPDTGRLHLPDDPDVADKMAAHVASMASSYSDQIDDRSGEGSHAEGRGHAKRAMTALEKLRDTLDAHAADLRAKATAGAATTKKQEHEAKAAMHRAEAGKLPDDDVRVKLHHAAADEHDRAARWHGSTHIKNWDRAAAMTGERANGLSAEVEATDARLKANATAAAEAKLKSATHPSTKVAAEHDAKAAEHKAAAAKAGRNSSEESQHLYAAHLHKQTAHLHREVAAGRMGEANAKAASLGANEASEIANRTSAPSMTHQEAQAKAREHEQKGEHFGTINGGYGAAMYHAKAAQAWAGAAKMLREGSLAPEHAAGYLDHAQQHSDRAAKEEAETPHRIRAREAAAVHEHTAKQHTKAANEATKTGERSAHLEAAKLHTQAARDAHGYSNSTFDPNEISNRKDYESSVVAALKQSEHANTLSGAKPAQAAAEPQKAPVAASFDVQKNTGRETVNGHRIGNFGVHDDAPLHGGLATVTHIPTGLRVASDLSPEDGLALAKHLHEKAGDAHGTAEFGTPLNKDHPDSKRVLDALQSATAKPKPADVAKAIRNSAADHRARQDAAVTYAERAETHRTKAREATDTRVREAHSKAAEAHDKAAVELRKFAGNWSATHDAGKAKQTAEDAEAQARRDATAKPPEPKPAAEAKPAKVEPVARAMEALRKILPHRDADPEDRYRARWHIPKKGHMHATSIENHPEMQRAKVSPRHIADAVKRLQMRGEVEQMNTSAAGGGYSVRRTGDGGVDPTVDRRRRDEEMDRLRSS